MSMAMFVSRDAPISFNPRQVDQRIEWESEGLHLLERFRGSTDAWITVDPSIQLTILNLMARAAPAFARAANRHLVPVAQEAFALWPVRTGLSKSLLALEATVSPDGGELDVRIVNRAPYAGFIGRGQVVEELVFLPGAQAAERMVDELAGEIPP